MIYRGKKVTLQAHADNIVELCFDAQDASVNVFNDATVDELTAALKLLRSTKNVCGLLITSAKPVLVVGADITEFKNTFVLPPAQLKKYFAKNNKNFNQLESFAFPSVVAINGFALGGGLELCLACDYRVMSSGAKIGLPETGLGILPGWGGTVRLPRIATLSVAMEWIGSARHYTAEQALAAQVVDEVVSPDGLRDSALSFLRAAMADQQILAARRARKLGALDIDPAQALAEAEAAKAALLRRTPKLIAPAAAIDHLVASAQVERDAALAMELNVFKDLSSTAQARALVGNFLNDQYTSKVAKTLAKQASVKLEQVAVIGAGIMGGGIAYQNAVCDIPVLMKDIHQAALELGLSEARSILEKRFSKAPISQAKKDGLLEKITPTLDLAVISGADITIEAVVENASVKSQVLIELEETLSANAIIASNTSTLSISGLAKNLTRPANFAGLHFFNPVHAMPLVEVIRGKQTSEATIANLVAYAIALGKKPIVVNDCPAFLVNRVLFPYMRAFEQLVLEGNTFEHIDSVMQDWGWPMGPAYLADVVGLDTLDHCLGVLSDDFPERMSRPSQSIITALYERNDYGQKTGAGFYTYTTNAEGRRSRSPNPDALALLDTLSTVSAPCDDETIIARCLLPMATEMARCLEEGVVASPAEADVALLNGVGFPAFRGGLVRWMDEVGVAKLCQLSDRYAALGEGYQATPTMRAMAASDSTYY